MPSLVVGFRMPAEWEPHAATWIGWPHNKSDWPGKFAPIPWVYGEIVRKLAPGEIIRILVNSAKHQSEARGVLKQCGVDLGRVEFLRFPTNRGWTRDFGPLFVRKDGPPPGLRSRSRGSTSTPGPSTPTGRRTTRSPSALRGASSGGYSSRK